MRAGVFGALALVCVQVSGAQTPTTKRTLEPCDLLSIECPEMPAICVRRTVERDGTIALPVLGSLIVVGRTPAALETMLGRALRADVNIRLLGAPGAPVSLTGYVGSPLELTYTSGLKLSRMLSIGGVAATADLGHVRVESVDGAVSVIDTQRVDYALRPGDRIYVPASVGGRTVLVVGDVVRPGAITEQPGLTVSEIVDRAGGIRVAGAIMRVSVERAQESIPVDEPSKFQVQSGDIVRLELSTPYGVMAVRGNVVHPLRIAVKLGMKLTAALRVAGGPRPGAPADFVVLRRAVGDWAGTHKIDLRALYTGQTPDPVVKANDIVEVTGG